MKLRVVAAATVAGLVLCAVASARRRVRDAEREAALWAEAEKPI